MKMLKEKWKEWLSLLFATMLFFLCLYPFRALLNYHEQTHLFRWNGYYLREQCSSIGGCLEYLVSFITQFFYIGWLGSAVISLLALLIVYLVWQVFKVAHIGKPYVFPITLLVPGLLYYYGFFPKEYRDDGLFRESVEYDYLVRSRQWSKILAKSYNHPPETMNGIWCTNFALAQRGTLLDDMFLYKQDGPDGLLMDAQRMHPLTFFSLSDIAFEIGLVNSSERFAFDMKQRLPDNHKSGRVYQRLAEANLVNGHYKVAGKYLSLLQSTLFYGKMARQYMGCLGKDSLIDKDPLYGKLRRFRQKTNDQLAQVKDQMLEELVRENADNRLASDYLLAYKLLRLDLAGLTTLVTMQKEQRGGLVPKAVQEGVAGYWIMTHPDDSLPIPINKGVFETTVSYLTTIRQTGNMLDPTLDEPPFCQSYWHYHTKSMMKLKQMRP